MGRFNFIKEDYDQDPDPADEQKARQNISMSDSIDISQNDDVLEQHLRDIDEGIQSENTLHEFKHVFDDEYHAPKEVEIAVAIATENLVELVGFKAPGVDAIKNNAPGYKKGYQRYIKISTESVLGSIGDAIKAAFKRLVEMFKKLFDWITGKGSKEDRNKKEDEKHKKVEKNEEKSQENKDKVIKAVESNEPPKPETDEEKEKKKTDKAYEEKHGRTPMQDLVHQIAADKKNPREVIKKMHEDIKAVKQSNGKKDNLDAFTGSLGEQNSFIKFVDANFHHVLNRELMKKTEIDIEQLIVHGNYLDGFVNFVKYVESKIEKMITGMSGHSITDTMNETLDLADSSSVPEEDFIKIMSADGESDDEFFSSMPATAAYVSGIKDLKSNELFGFYLLSRQPRIVTIESSPYKIKKAQLQKLQTDPPNIKFTFNVPNPAKNKVNDRKRWNDKINKCIKETNDILAKIKVKINDLGDKIENIQEEINNFNYPDMFTATARGRAIMHYNNMIGENMIMGLDVLRTLVTNCEVTHEFIGTNIRKVMNASDDIADVETIQF